MSKIDGRMIDATAASKEALVAMLAVTPDAALGLCVNPFFEVSQENGAVLGSVSSYYGVDQWACNFSGASVVMNTQQVADPFSEISGFRRLRRGLKMTVATAQASLVGSDLLGVFQKIEGTFWKALGFGTADASAVDIVAIVHASVAGTYSLSLRNGAANRSYVVPVALVSGINVVLVTVPGDTSGTWATDTGVAAILQFSCGSGSTLTAPSANAWVDGNYFDAPGGTLNMAATLGATLTIGYMNVFAHGVLPWSSASEITGEALQRLLNMRRGFDDELRRCQRYWCSTYPYGTRPGTATNAGAIKRLLDAAQSYAPPGIFEFPVEMRSSSPAVAVYSPLDGASGAMVSDGVNKSPVATEVGAKRGFAYMNGVSIGAMASLGCHMVLNARM